MRDKLHDFLLQRPAGVRTDELVDLVFRQPGGDPTVAERVVAELLRDDPRFRLRDADGMWHATVHAALAQPIAATTFTVLDLEMTGLEPARTAIIEIGAARVRDGRVVEEFQQLVNPRIRLPPFIVGLTGIDDAMLADAPHITEVWPQFRAFVGDTILVAHNAAFDIACLNRTSMRLSGRELDNHQICTLKLARLLLPELGKRGLDALAGHFGILQADRHRALGDVRVTVEVMFHLLEILQARGIDRLDQVLEFQNHAHDGRPFVSFLPREKVASLPEVPGIYRLLGEAGELLYIGKAKNLRERVASYLTNAAAHGDRTLDLIRATHDVRVEMLGSELEAALAEAEAIRHEKPPFNRLGRHLPRIAFIKLGLNDEFPRLSITKKMSARGRARYIGPFRSSKEAERIRDILTREFRLRTCSGTLHPDPAFAPCSQYTQGRCTAPCAGRVAADAYADQVDVLIGRLHGQTADLDDLLANRARQRENRRQYEGAVYSKRELDALRALVGIQRQLGWLFEQQHWVVFERAVDRRIALAYGIVAGRLAMRARLSDEAEIDGFCATLRAALTNPPTSTADDIEGTTILAAWMRDRTRERGCVFPIADLTLPDAEVFEWRIACRELLAGPGPARD